MPADRQATKASPLRVGLGLIGLALLALALYVGRELIEPPPPPDLGGVAAMEVTPRAQESDGVVGTTAPSAAPPAIVEPTLDAAPQPEATGTILHSPSPGFRTPGGPARLAVVIDDLGRSLEEVDALTSIGVALTYSVLPFESRTPAVVARLAGLGEEILCHLPMEPLGPLDPGPGALRSTMSAAELVRATQSALAAVPGATGVNNHMGSGMSSHRQAMTTVLEVLVDHGLYYLDSRTTADTVGYSVARELGLAAGERQVFLDADRDPAAILTQFRRLLDVARSRGGAIAIAHPYPETLAILQQELPLLLDLGFEIVPASELLDHSG